MSDKYKVFLTDDHQLILDSLQSLLAQTPDFEVIATARNGREALRKVPVLQPDLVLMDLDMPGGLNGIETTRQLKAQLPELKIVILSMHLEQSLVRDLQQIGADGYMVKDSSREEFLHGLSLVMQGTRYYSSRVTQALIENSEPPSALAGNHQLTDREREVLRLLVEGYSSKEIATELQLGLETINTYRKSLLRKLEARNVAHLVKIALQAGIII